MLSDTYKPKFAVSHLSYADPTVPPVWPVEGAAVGDTKVMIVSLVLKTESKCLNVYFVVDDTSPRTFISPTTMQVLLPGEPLEHLPTSIRANLHGQDLELMLSPQTSHFADLNLLGVDFLAKCILWMNNSFGEEERYSLSLKNHP